MGTYHEGGDAVLGISDQLVDTREREVGNNIKNEVWFTIYVEVFQTGCTHARLTRGRGKSATTSRMRCGSPYT
jgi:hypothetical protein